MNYRVKLGQKRALVEANYLLFQNEQYITYLESVDRWRALPRKKVCEQCGAKGKTVLHHKNAGIKPKKLVGMDGMTYIPKKSLEMALSAIVEDFLEGDLEQCTKYFNTERAELEELCPACHAKKHKELREKEKQK